MTSQEEVVSRELARGNPRPEQQMLRQAVEDCKSEAEHLLQVERGRPRAESNVVAAVDSDLALRGLRRQIRERTCSERVLRTSCHDGTVPRGSEDSGSKPRQGELPVGTAPRGRRRDG